MEFVIIGGDAAGMSAASRAKRSMPDMNVTVLEKSQDVSYSACGMPYNIAVPQKEIEELVVRQADVFREKQGINLLTGHLAQQIDPTAKTVSGTTDLGDTFSVPYDKLLIATGASAIVPDLPGFDLPGVLGLKTLDDGRRIKAYLQDKKVKKVVIIGMGYIALEMCESLRSRSIDVDMVKPRPVFLPWMNEQLSNTVKQELENNDVGFFPGHTLEKIQPAADGSLEVVCSDLTLQGDMVLVAIGVSPNSQIAVSAGLELSINDSIAVDPQLLTSNQDIYAAGDCADAYHIITKDKVYLPLALRANRGGWAAADNICGKNIKLDGIVGTSVFKVFDLEVARCGFNYNEAVKAGFNPVEVTITTRSRAHAHPGSTPIQINMVADLKTGQLLGTQMVGKEGVAQRINTIAVALHCQITVAKFAQSDLAYAPPFSPVWDPLLTAANQMLKKLK